MPTLRTYTIQFDTPLYPRQIPSFRESLIRIANDYEKILAKKELSLDLFTNECKNADGTKKTIERYPAIQYKIIDKHAAVTGIQKGADALKLVWKLWKENEKRKSLYGLSQSNSQATEKEYNCKMITGTKMYRMYHWLALNPENEKKYKAMPKLTDKIKLLEKILVQHIEKMAKDNDCALNKKVKVFLGQLTHIERNPFKGRAYLAFNCTFGCNLLIPEEIGLGNSPAFGFGKIQYLPVYNLLKQETAEEEIKKQEKFFDILEK